MVNAPHSPPGGLLSDLRKLLVVGATSVIRRARGNALASASWVKALLERRPARVATVAMANKTARIAWAVLARGTSDARRRWAYRDCSGQKPPLKL